MKSDNFSNGLVIIFPIKLDNPLIIFVLDGKSENLTEELVEFCWEIQLFCMYCKYLTRAAALSTLCN